ncbi:MAG: hypothetical protein GY867_02010 [bacterium]|nr:hypothetical protein [bacterium]
MSHPICMAYVYYRGKRMNSLLLALTLIIFTPAVAGSVDSVDPRPYPGKGEIDTILAPEGGFYHWSYSDSLIAVALVKDTLLFADLAGNVRYTWPAEVEPDDYVYILPGDSLYAHVHNRYVRASNWLMESILRLYASLAGWRSEIVIRRIESNELVCKQGFWGQQIDVDYSPDMGVLAVLSDYNGYVLLVIDVANDTTRYEEAIPLLSPHVLFDSNSLYVVDLLGIAEYAISPEKEILPVRKYDFGMGLISSERTRACFYDGVRKQQIVFNELCDSTVGPIELVNDPPMVQRVRTYLRKHSLGGPRSYDAANLRLYVSTSDRIIEADFRNRTVGVYGTGDCLGWSNTGWIELVGGNKFLASHGWSYPIASVICLYDITECPRTEITEYALPEDSL